MPNIKTGANGLKPYQFSSHKRCQYAPKAGEEGRRPNPNITNSSGKHLSCILVHHSEGCCDGKFPELSKNNLCQSRGDHDSEETRHPAKDHEDTGGPPSANIEE